MGVLVCPSSYIIPLCCSFLLKMSGIGCCVTSVVSCRFRAGFCVLLRASPFLSSLQAASADDSEWSEYEERAGVVSRVLQVLRCDGLLREARKALQASSRDEMMDVEVDVRAADIELSLPAGQEEDPNLAATAAPTAGDGGVVLLQGEAHGTKTGSPMLGGTAGAEEVVTAATAAAAGGAGAAAGAAGAAAVTNQDGSIILEGGISRRNQGGVSDEAQPAVIAPSGEVTRVFEQRTLSMEMRGAVTGVSLSVPDVKTSFQAPQLLHTREPMACNSLNKADWQTDPEAVCLRRKQETRRSVWMRGERSEGDLHDDPKIRELRALIPELLETVPEWLDAKLDTGRRGEWLGFQKILPVILRQRFGFTGNDLCKEGPFCWKGSRRTSAMEANTLLLPAGVEREAHHSHAGPCCSSQEDGGGEADVVFHEIQPKENQQKEDQQQFHDDETQAQQQQSQLHVLHPEVEVPPRQQTEGAGLLIFDEGQMKEKITEVFPRGGEEQLDEQQRYIFPEAMDIDEESDEYCPLGKTSYYRGTSDDRKNSQVGRWCFSSNRNSGSSNSSNACPTKPVGNMLCGKQGSHSFRELACTVQQLRDKTAVVLEVTSIWVNGFQESGKPYDVQIQARVDGHLARVLYVEIKATVAAQPCFVLSLPQLEFARVQGPENYIVMVICSIRTASPAWMLFDNVAERVNRSLRSPLLPSMVDSSLWQAATTAPSKIRCRLKKQLNTSDLAARGQLAVQSVDDILGCLLKPSCH